MKKKEQEPILLLENAVLIPRSYDVEVDEKWRRHTTPGETYPGECFKRACQFIDEMFFDRETRDLCEELLFVYGTSIVASSSIPDHTWIELPGGVVFDGVMQRFLKFPKRRREPVYKAWYKFSALAIMLIHNWLPSRSPDVPLAESFLEPLGLPRAPKNIVLMNDEQACELLKARGLITEKPKRTKQPARRKKSNNS